MLKDKILSVLHFLHCTIIINVFFLINSQPCTYKTNDKHTLKERSKESVINDTKTI